MNVDLWHTVDAYCRAGDIDGAAEHLASLLQSHSSDRFMSLADAAFANPAATVLEHINSFLSVSADQFDMRAAYFEMNGFDINYDRWYFDSFGYADYSDDPDDLEWLCDWSSPDWHTMTLTGLEEAQDDFRWYSENEAWEIAGYNQAKETATLLVMVRFLQLIRLAVSSDSLTVVVPVLATAHGFDIVGRFEP